MVIISLNLRKRFQSELWWGCWDQPLLTTVVSFLQYPDCSAYLQIVSKAMERAREDQLHWLLTAQRCTGLTAEIVEKGKLRVCFETSYNGGHFKVIVTACILGIASRSNDPDP